jgi:biotin carboxylase
VHLAVLAHGPTDSVTHGFLPAADLLGAQVTMVTDDPQAHRTAYGDAPSAPALVAADVTDPRAVITAVTALPPLDGVFSNSDHLQAQTALAADYLGLPGKDWSAAWACKDKALMRRRLAERGLDAVTAVAVDPGDDVAAALEGMCFPAVVKPRQGVASEDVVLVADHAEACARVEAVLASRPGGVLVEEFLGGGLCSLETVGDGQRLHVLGGFRTELSPPPNFVEERMVFDAAPDPAVVAQVLGQLQALGVGLGACHTEYVVQEGRARLIEVNYRAIGDQCDLLLADLLGVDLFGLVLGVHAGARLPAELGARRDGRARVEYVCADRSGRLVAAPAPLDVRDRGVSLSYRPLREVGVSAPVTRTNRDYLGVVRAHGTDQGAVDTAVAEFLRSSAWEIAPEAACA